MIQLFGDGWLNMLQAPQRLYNIVRMMLALVYKTNGQGMEIHVHVLCLLVLTNAPFYIS